MTNTVSNPQEPQVDKGGVWIQLGDKGYKAPPLNFKAIKKYVARFGELGALGAGAPGVPTPDQMGLAAELLHAALIRNYPELTLDEVEENLDMGNFNAALAAVMGASGLKKEAAPGEATKAGGPPS